MTLINYFGCKALLTLAMRSLNANDNSGGRVSSFVRRDDVGISTKTFPIAALRLKTVPSTINQFCIVIQSRSVTVDYSTSTKEHTYVNCKTNNNDAFRALFLFNDRSF